MGSRALFILLLTFTVNSSLAQEGSAYPIAGIHPDRRPDSVPIIQEVHHNGAWFNQALTGLSQPYPHSFRFLEDQGNWYTPFNRPGMTSPYDIRSWHR